MQRLKIIVCIQAMLSCFTTFAQTDTVYKPVELLPGFTSKLNVVYTQVNGWDGKMDIYLPPQDKGPTPVVINIHGGGWNKGVKKSQTGFNTFFKTLSRSG